MKVLKSIVVRIHKERIFFSESHSLDLNQTNLPIDHISFTVRPVFWKLLLERFNKKSGVLSAYINNYDEKGGKDWVGKTPKYDIEYISFLKVDWEKFKGCLVYYDGKAKQLIPDNEVTDMPLPVKEILLSHKVRIKDLDIHQGFVSYIKKVRWEKDPIEINIQHQDMFSKLKYVKPYFSKIIGKKTIDVNLVIGRQKGKTVYVKASSSDLMKIDRESLYVIKTFETSAVKKRLKELPGDNIFREKIDISIEDLAFGNIDELEKALLFSILENENILNSNQLTFLSEIMDDQRLMITLEPQFGFIFTITGEEMVHCIWELINSHATYIWSFQAKKLKRNHIKRLEQEFAVITTHGRSHYRRHFENSNDLYLHIVNHKRRANPMVDHFAEWRLKFESLMV